jgi:hypothetical protein
MMARAFFAKKKTQKTLNKPESAFSLCFISPSSFPLKYLGFCQLEVLRALFFFLADASVFRFLTEWPVNISPFQHRDSYIAPGPCGLMWQPPDHSGASSRVRYATLLSHDRTLRVPQPSLEPLPRWSLKSRVRAFEMSLAPWLPRRTGMEGVLPVPRGVLNFLCSRW